MEFAGPGFVVKSDGSDIKVELKEETLQPFQAFQLADTLIKIGQALQWSAALK